MDHVLKQMEYAVILSSEDITRFKQYILKKYADHTSAHRAGVLADSLYRAVDPHLDGIESSHRDPLKRSLFENTLAKNINRISKKDIFSEIVQLNTTEDEIQKNAFYWVKRNITENVTIIEIGEYVKNERQRVGSDDLIADVLAKIDAEIAQEREARKTIERAARKSLSGTIPDFQKELSRIPTAETKPQRFQLNGTHLPKLSLPKIPMPSIELTSIEIPRPELPKLKLPKLEMPRVEVPRFELPKLEIPKINVSAIEVPEIDFSGIQWPEIKLKKSERRKLVLTVGLALCVAILCLTVGADFLGIRVSQAIASVDFTEARPAAPPVGIEEMVPTLPVFSYEEFDVKKLREELEKNHSKLAESPYFETIMKTAKAHGIDPRLLFAITGQEQGFVKKENVNAKKIANNPFNVYGSWQAYNTNIKDSAHIVCNTLVHRLEAMPADVDPLVWINQKYAEDKNWNNGVRAYYKKLNELTDISK